jgi:hypothetical protein
LVEKPPLPSSLLPNKEIVQASFHLPAPIRFLIGLKVTQLAHGIYGEMWCLMPKPDNCAGVGIVLSIALQHNYIPFSKLGSVHSGTKARR